MTTLHLKFYLSRFIVVAGYPIQMGLDRNHHLTEHVIHVSKLPGSVGVKWKDLARALGFVEATIEAIEKEKGASNNECCIQLLVRWLRQKGKDATAGKLADALTRIGLKNFADKLITAKDPSQVRL